MINNCGFLGVNKCVGVSSARVVARVKHLLKTDAKAIKVGHMGTLDVEASGVLVLAIGNATKLFDLFLVKEKTYRTVFEFGYKTDTDDHTGNIIAKTEQIPTEKELLEKVKLLKSKTMQIPPQFCANKIDGQKAYKLARQGEFVELKTKPIQIFEFKLLKQISKNRFEFLIRCSSGTYIRALCRDLAQMLSTYGVTTVIERTKCGVFLLENCLNFEDLNKNDIEQNIKNVNEVILNLKTKQLDREATIKLKNGLEIDCGFEDGQWFIENAGKVCCVAISKNGKLKQKICLEN